MRIDVKNERNLTMLTDFYELTMSNGYFMSDMKDSIAVFDMFFRKNPDSAGFAIFAGLEQLIDYLKNICFTDEDIDYMRSKKLFDDRFLEYLRNFKFTCDVYAMPEGTVVFPHEPLITVRGPIIEVQLIETMVLLTLNFQSLVATKANRIVRAGAGRSVFEFGSRRAQSYDAAVLGARAAYIGGCDGTACVMADRDYQIPAIGTMAHSWVQMFDSEFEAFSVYAKQYPDNCTLLVDTYSTIKSGMPNAIKVAKEILEPAGHKLSGVRIDSGDIAYLSKKMRAMLDSAGMHDCKIIASNSLDETIIRGLILQDAQVDVFGVGENLITSKSDPVFGGVYKLVAIERDGEYIPKIKLSESIGKNTTPDFKRIYRIYSKSNGRALADYIACHDEQVLGLSEIEIFDPIETWKKQYLKDIEIRELHVEIFKNGVDVYTNPELDDIRSYCLSEVGTLWEEVTRFENPHRYYVDLSQKLWDKRRDTFNNMSKI